MQTLTDLVARYLLKSLLYPENRPLDISTLTHPKKPPAIDLGQLNYQFDIVQDQSFQGDLYKPKDGEMNGLLIQMPGRGHNRRSSATLRHMIIYLTQKHNLGVLSINSTRPDNTLGIKEKDSFHDAIKYAQNTLGVERIGAFGQSAGANAVALAVAQYHLAHPEAFPIPVLLDSPHRNVETLIREDVIPSLLKRHLPTKMQGINFSFLNLPLPLARVIALAKEQGIDFTQGNVEKALETIPSARFVVHNPDYRIPTRENAVYLANKHAERTNRNVDEILFITKNGKPGHANSAEIDPQGFFENAVDPFVGDILGRPVLER